MARSFASNQVRTRSPRRKTSWEFGPGGTTANSFSSSTTAILGGGVAAAENGLTLVRLRGSLQAFLKTSDQANGGFHCVMGIGVASSDAFVIGVTALPNPADDPSWPGWLYWRVFDVHTFDATIASSFGPAGLAAIQFEVDSKAMRKLGINETIFASVQTIEAGAATMSIFFESRTLVKLP